MNKPLTQKEKLANKVQDLRHKNLQAQLDLRDDNEEEVDNDVESDVYLTALEHLPNRVLADIIRRAKAKIKELKEENKDKLKEEKRQAKEEE